LLFVSFGLLKYFILSNAYYFFFSRFGTKQVA
jgi:hypothetical protein